MTFSLFRQDVRYGLLVFYHLLFLFYDEAGNYSSFLGGAEYGCLARSLQSWADFCNSNVEV
jgi:hypothetical protein